MEPFCICAGMGIFFPLVLGGSLFAAHHQRQKREVLLRSVAEKFHGTVTTGGLFSQPELSFEHAGWPVTLRFLHSGGKHKTYWTELKLVHSQPTPRVSITPQGFFDEIFSSLGGQDIEVGNTGFDSQFRIRGGPEHAVKEVLTGAAQRCIQGLDLRAIHLGRASFTTSIRNWVTTSYETTQFITQSLQIYDTLVNAHSDPFEKMAQARGLQLASTQEPSGYKITGTTNEVSIHAIYEAKDASTHIRAKWAAGSSDTLNIIHKDKASREQSQRKLDLANPVLDHMICASGSDTEQVRRFLNQPGVADGVLPVVHGYPGSVITGTHVDLVAKKLSAEQIGEAIDLVVTAVKALSGAEA